MMDGVCILIFSLFDSLAEKTNWMHVIILYCKWNSAVVSFYDHASKLHHAR
jgi:hypothetical protein